MSGRVDSFRVDGWDEDGFIFLVGTDDDEHRFRITDTGVAAAFLAAVAPAELEPLREWIADGARELAAYQAASPDERVRVLLGRGIAADDPSEQLREGADLARKADRER